MSQTRRTSNQELLTSYKDQPMTKTVVGTCLLLVLAGVVTGLLVERLIPSRRALGNDQAVRVREQSATLVNIRHVGKFEVFYPEPFEVAPALDIFDDNPKSLWAFEVTEQQSDGFKLNVTKGAIDDANKQKQLRYVAKGLPLAAESIAVQRGDVDPTDQVNCLSFNVYYPRPYAQPPALKLRAPGPIGWETRIAEQWPHGFRVRLTSYSKTDEKCARYEARGILRKPDK